MTRRRAFSILLVTAVALAGQPLAAAAQKTAEPRVFLIDIKGVDWKKLQADPAVMKLERDARQAFKAEVASIVSKKLVPPTGDKHDYMSQSPYFWRNPNTPNGLPYIRRDGERNPEILQHPDPELLNKMVGAVEKLSLGYLATGKEEYAVRAGEILRMWFIDPATKMNTNLDFAQFIPGLNTGRGFGIIETRGLTRVVDAVGMLAGSKTWTRSDHARIQSWFSKYISWLMESKNGREESAAKNNHGTHYDVQLASFALFVGNNALAKRILEQAKQKRIAKQIESDGSQLLELERTQSWNYSTMNLDGMVSLARLGEHVGIDLWSFQTADGRSIRKAIEFLEPYARGSKTWPHKQISPMQPERFYSIVRRASRHYKDGGFQKVAASAPKLEPDDIRRIVGR